MPAPSGNLNALRTGKRVRGLRASGLPAGYEYQEREINALRDLIADEIIRVHGEMSVYHGLLLQSVCRKEMKALVAAKALRDTPDLKLAEKLACLAAISEATESRDKTVKVLCIDRLANEGRDPWEEIDAHRRPALGHVDITPAGPPSTDSTDVNTSTATTEGTPTDGPTDSPQPT